MRPAAFLDRDGTIIEDTHYPCRAEGIRLLPGVADAIRMLNGMDLPVVIVTNQSGIARGLLSELQFQKMQSALEQALHKLGCHVAATYHCPHGPLERCSCRKPEPGLLHRASEELGIDLNASFVIGDKISDLEAGRCAGCQTGLVLTGKGRDAYALMETRGAPRPDYVAGSLIGMAGWIVRQTALRHAPHFQTFAGRGSEYRDAQDARCAEMPTVESLVTASQTHS